MDIPFLKLMSDAYVSDCIQPLNINEVEQYLLTSFGEFKYNYPEMATELYTKSRSYQQDLIYSFLDNQFLVKEDYEYEVENDYINEAHSLKTIWTTIGKYLGLIKSNIPPSQQFVFSIIEKNYNNCNRMCYPSSVLSNDLLTTLMYINPNSSIENRNNPKLKKLNPNFNINAVSKCIRICYLDYITSIYAEGIVAFENCVKNLTGNDITISNYSDILKSYPIHGMCNEVYITLNDIYKELNQLLDTIYLGDSFKKKKWLDVIFVKLDAFKKGRSYKIDFTKVDDEFDYPGDNVRIVSQ